MRQAGTYYHSADFFYHELWRERLRQIGFRVVFIERTPERNHLLNILLHFKINRTLAHSASSSAA